ncbi:MAG: synthase subunit b [Patescibacteria group bacterium]|nr:synthase subunit b [Patescibacteria group bacterium]
MDALQKLGIDGWSIVLYALNTLLLVGILTKLLYKPVLQFLDERRDTIRRNLSEAELLRKSFQEEAQKQKASALEETKRLRAELASLKAEAETEAKTLLEEATARREAMLAEALAQTEAIKARVMQDTEQAIRERIERVVLQVLEKGLPQDVVRASVQTAWDKR